MIKFIDNRVQVKAKIDTSTLNYLEEVKDSIASQAERLSPVKTGRLKDSYLSDSVVSTEAKTAYIGSTVEYSIWVELGTGEYALNGNGRKGGWVYQDEFGKFHKTKGQEPKRPLYQAYIMKKDKLIQRGKELFND